MNSRSPSFPSPPAWAERFRSDDLDEVRAVIARRDGEHSRVVHRAGPLGFELCHVAGTAASIGWGRVALDKTIRGALGAALLHLKIPPGSVYRFGRRAHVASGRDAMFIAPGWEFTRRSPPGSVLAVALNTEQLDEEIAARVPAAGGGMLLRSRPVRVREPAQAKLAEAVDEVVQATAPGCDPQQLASGEATLIGTVAGLLIEESAVVRAHSLATARVVDVEAWIDAHLDKPITVGMLCRVAGVGERALQKIFESRRGMSPMRFVAERRLAAAHRLLRGAGAAKDVTGVALSLGFHHTGRFAALYQQAFGESPSRSLRQARRRG